MPWFLPEQSSEWTTGDLSKLNVYYDDRAKSISEFMTILSVRSNRSELKNDLPEECKCKRLIGYTNDFFNFEFDFDIRRTGGKKNTLGLDGERQKKIKDGIDNAEELRRRLEEKETELDVFEELRRLNDHKRLEMLYVWRSNILEFLGFFADILRRWDHESHREGKFVYLFMLFSKVCRLRPEPGDAFMEMLKIKNKEVKGYPDVRFISCSSEGDCSSLEGDCSSSEGDCKTVAVTEVKKEDAFLTRNKKGGKPKDKKKKNPLIYEDIPERVLGQHGIELLQERKRSFFQSGTLGIICIGTKVYFTFLDINDAKFAEIQKKGKVKKAEKVNIVYTRGFDYMKAEERKELLVPLFKIALLQTPTSDPAVEN